MWDRLHGVLLKRLNAAGEIDLVARGRRLQPHPRPFGGLLTGPSLVDRARARSKHHLMTDASGLPLAITLTGGNRNDITQLLPLLDAVGPLAGKVGRPRKRPNRVIADRGYGTTSTAARSGGAGSSLSSKAPHRARLGPGARALGRRAHLRLAAPVPKAPHPLGARPRPAPRLHAPGLRRHLLAATGVIVKPLL